MDTAFLVETIWHATISVVSMSLFDPSQYLSCNWGKMLYSVSTTCWNSRGKVLIQESSCHKSPSTSFKLVSNLFFSSSFEELFAKQIPYHISGNELYHGQHLGIPLWFFSKQVSVGREGLQSPATGAGPWITMELMKGWSEEAFCGSRQLSLHHASLCRPLKNAHT